MGLRYFKNNSIPNARSSKFSFHNLLALSRNYNRLFRLNFRYAGTFSKIAPLRYYKHQICRNVVTEFRFAQLLKILIIICYMKVSYLSIMCRLPYFWVD